MSQFRLGSISRKNLIGVHKDLIQVVEHAIEITTVDFRVAEGVRTIDRQMQLMAVGASHTLRSRHLTGHAIDLVALIDGKVRWDWPLYCQIANAMKNSAEDLGVKVRWGGSWKILNGGEIPSASMLHKTFPDGPHFELPSN